MNSKSLFSVFVSSIALAQFAFAEIKTEVVEYQEGSTTLQGLQSYDDSIQGKRPGSLSYTIGWASPTTPESIARRSRPARVRGICRRYLRKGVRPEDTKASAAEAGKYKADRPLLRKRVSAGLAELEKNTLTDSKRVAAIGFVSENHSSGTGPHRRPNSRRREFHGGLDSPTPEDGKNIKAKVLVLHGADDPFVKAADITAFQEELRQGGADWQMMYYGDAVHPFTQKKSGTDKSKGAAYNEPAARRSWQGHEELFRRDFCGERMIETNRPRLNPVA